jgi:FkbM family methyltransferase
MYEKNLIYDVGMHNGDDTAYYLSKGFNVVSIEADPDQANKARAKFAKYIEEGKLTILNIGVSKEEGEFEFYVNEVQPEWNSFDLAIASRDNLPWHAIRIKTHTFDQILRKHGVPYYCKVDIEGNDYLCIRGLNEGDLPKYISVEGNEIGLIDQLAAKGFTRFKIVMQYNLEPLEVPANQYFKNWLKSRELRLSNSFFMKVFRKFGGRSYIHWVDQTASSPANRHFPKGYSGNFGEFLNGQWHDLQQAKKIYDHYQQVFQQLPGIKDYGYWVDIHATW